MWVYTLLFTLSCFCFRHRWSLCYVSKFNQTTSCKFPITSHRFMICFFAFSILVQYRTKGANRSNVMKDSLAFPNVQGSYFWWFGLCDKALKERIRAGLISCQFCWTCSSIVLFNWISWTKIIITANADYESINEKQMMLTMKASIRI